MLTKRVESSRIFLAKFSYFFLKGYGQLHKLTVNLPYPFFQVLFLQSILVRRAVHGCDIIQVQLYAIQAAGRYVQLRFNPLRIQNPFLVNHFAYRVFPAFLILAEPFVKRAVQTGKQLINLRNLFTNLRTVSLKTFLLMPGDLFHFRLFHLILGSNLSNLAFHRSLPGSIFFLSPIQLQKPFIYPLYFISQRMPLAEFLQRIVGSVLFSQQHLQAFVRFMPPAVKSIHNLIPILCAFLFQPVAFYLKFCLFLIICLLLNVLECLTCILQFTPCDVVLFLYRCMGFQ